MNASALAEAKALTTGRTSGDVVQRAPWLLVASGKGGSGKTTTSLNIAAHAAHAGLRVALVDLDTQLTLSKWHARRHADLPAIRLFSIPMSRLEHAIAKVEEAETVDGFDLVIVDTPPNLDHWDVQARQIVARAEHVLVPTLQGRADIDSVREWMKLLQRQDASAAFLLNATNRQTKSFIAARSALLKVGTLCPIDVRRLEDVQLTHSLGCGLCEMKNVKGSEDLEGLWDHVRRVMRI